MIAFRILLTRFICVSGISIASSSDVWPIGLADRNPARTRSMSFVRGQQALAAPQTERQKTRPRDY